MDKKTEKNKTMKKQDKELQNLELSDCSYIFSEIKDSIKNFSTEV